MFSERSEPRGTLLRTKTVAADMYVQGGPKKRIAGFIFGITSVIQHRF